MENSSSCNAIHKSHTVFYLFSSCVLIFFELQKQSMARHVCHSHFSKISRHVIFVLAERNEILILELKISP